MAQFQILYWHDIPVQVRARDSKVESVVAAVVAELEAKCPRIDWQKTAVSLTNKSWGEIGDLPVTNPLISSLYCFRT